MTGSKPPVPLVLASAPRGAAAIVRDEIAALEEAGIDGVHAGDHLAVEEIIPEGGASRPGEPLALLGAAGMSSNKLVLATMVANLALTPPLSIARTGAQMAELFGGDRVWAGIGAGWSPADYRITGKLMPCHQKRMDMLTESATLLRDLFDKGRASASGPLLHLDELQLSPLPSVPPRLLIGGGSQQVLELAGATADVVDLNSPYQPRAPGGSWDSDLSRRASTTLDDIERAVDFVATQAHLARRPRPLFSITVDLVNVMEAGSEGGAPTDSPYVLVGSVEQVTSKVRALVEAGIGAIAVARGALVLRKLLAIHLTP